MPLPVTNALVLQLAAMTGPADWQLVVVTALGRSVALDAAPAARSRRLGSASGRRRGDAAGAGPRRQPERPAHRGRHRPGGDADRPHQCVASAASPPTSHWRWSWCTTARCLRCAASSAGDDERWPGPVRCRPGRRASHRSRCAWRARTASSAERWARGLSDLSRSRGRAPERARTSRRPSAWAS